MKTILLLAAATILISQNAHCQLGKTMAECVQLYGEGTDTADGGTLFKTPDLFIIVKLLNDRVGYVLVQSSKLDASKKPAPLTDAQIQGFLKDSQGEGTWVQMQAGPPATIWESADGYRAARYTQGKNTLMLATKAFAYQVPQKAAP